MNDKTLTCPRCKRELPIVSTESVVEVPAKVTNGAFLFNGVYGCDSGCEYVTLEVGCPCGWWAQEGAFGYYESDEDVDEYLDEILTKIARNHGGSA